LSNRSYIAPLASLLLAFGGAGIMLAACEPRIVDVGTNDAAPVDPSPASIALDSGLTRSQYGCVDLADDDVRALRTGACGGQCSSIPELAYDLESKQAVVAALAGKWMYCAGSLGPGDAIGLELAPGCRVYFLRRDLNGVAVRGTEAAYQATYDIYDPRPTGTPRRIDLHLDDGTTLTFDVAAHRCPEHLQLASPGRTLELAPDFGDAGRPDPVAFR
jgi:hypothetical protein